MPTFTSRYVLPTQQGVPFYTQRLTLDGRDFNFRFAWNQRLERWYLDIRDGADVPLLVGLKLVTNWPLLQAYHHDERLPPGELVVFTSLPDTSPPGYMDLGIGLRCELVYGDVT